MFSHSFLAQSPLSTIYNLFLMLLLPCCKNPRTFWIRHILIYSIYIYIYSSRLRTFITNILIFLRSDATINSKTIDTYSELAYLSHTVFSLIFKSFIHSLLEEPHQYPKYLPSLPKQTENPNAFIRLFLLILINTLVPRASFLYTTYLHKHQLVSISQFIALPSIFKTPFQPILRIPIFRPILRSHLNSAF